jgi:hypothetical protein
MVDYVIARARERDVQRLRVQPVARNIEAVSFFIRAGFDMVGHIDLSQELMPESKIEMKTGLVIHGNPVKF